MKWMRNEREMDAHATFTFKITEGPSKCVKRGVRDRIRKRTIRLVRHVHGYHQLMVPTQTLLPWDPHGSSLSPLFCCGLFSTSDILFLWIGLLNQIFFAFMFLKLTNLPLHVHWYMGWGHPFCCYSSNWPCQECNSGRHNHMPLTMSSEKKN